MCKNSPLFPTRFLPFVCFFFPVLLPCALSLPPSLSLFLQMEAIFEDPVTFEVMRDAVVSACGHSFSMASISQWLERHDTCPICKHVLRVEECTPNYALRNAIEQVSYLFRFSSYLLLFVSLLYSGPYLLHDIHYLLCCDIIIAFTPSIPPELMCALLFPRFSLFPLLYSHKKDNITTNRPTNEDIYVYLPSFVVILCICSFSC